MDNGNLKEKSVVAFFWRFFQNISSKLCTFFIQIIIARLVLPSDYGIIAIASIFMTIADVFIQTGFASGIVQKQDITKEELSSVFYSGLLLSIVLYIILYFFAPSVAKFYRIDLLVIVIRVQAIRIIISSLYSVQTALIQRNLDYKKAYLPSIFGYILQALVGLFFAVKGYGVWALVYSNITYAVVYGIGISITYRWKPLLKISFKESYTIFSFSSKILGINLLNTLMNSLRALIVGRSYSADALGYYNRGYQFPTLIMVNIDGALSPVLFSALSRLQNNMDDFVNYLRKSLKLSLFVTMPMMFGLAAVSDSMIILLLTDKWSSAIPFVKIISFICCFWPLSAKLQAINAYGRSDIGLKLNIIFNLISVIFIFIFYRYNIYLFILSELISSFINFLISTYVVSKVIKYSIKQQLADILPVVLISSIMGICVYSIFLLFGVSLFTLLIQIVLGIVIYLILSYIFKLQSLYLIMNIIKEKFSRN